MNIRIQLLTALIAVSVAAQARADHIYCVSSVTADKTAVCVGEPVTISIDSTTCSNGITVGDGTTYTTNFAAAGVYIISNQCSACSTNGVVGGLGFASISVGQLSGISPSSATICPGCYLVFNAESAPGNIPCGPTWSLSPPDAGTISITNGPTTTVTLSPGYAGGTATLSASCGTTTNTATITVATTGLLDITSQPSPVDYCPGSSVTFSVAATGNSLSYQWLWNGMPLTDGGQISGATSSTLTISNVLPATSVTNSVPANNGGGTLFSYMVAGGLYTYQASGCANVGVFYADPDGNTYTNADCTGFFAGPVPAWASCQCPELAAYSLVDVRAHVQFGTSGQFQQRASNGTHLKLALNGTSHPAYSGSWEVILTHVMDGAYSCIVSSSCGSRISNAATLSISAVCDGIPDWWRAEYFGGDGTTTNSYSCASCVSTNPWAYGLTNLQLYDNPSVLVSNNYTTFNDGIPDWWRVKYFGTSTTNSQSCASCDPDHDGYSNLQEYLAGTDPTAYASQPIPANLIAWWKFDEGSGTITTDSSGHGQTAMITGDPIWTNGVVGGAMDFSASFDANNDYTSASATPTAFSLLTTQLTVAVWVKDYDLGQMVSEPYVVWDNGDSTSPCGFGLMLDPPDLVTFCMNPTGNGCWPSTWGAVIPTNVWVHLAAVYDGSTIRLYTNGLLAASPMPYTDDVIPCRDNPPAWNPVGLAVDNANTFFLNGALSDVRIYSTALSSNDVAALYNTDTVGDGVPNWWRLEYFGTPTSTNSYSCASCVSTNPWAYGLTNLQLYDNPSVLASNNYSTYNDGIPDWWRVKYFGATTTNEHSCASCDPDGDGYSNLQEYLAGTDPTVIGYHTSFTNNPAFGQAPITVTFYDTSVCTSPSTNRYWDFGDGTVTNVPGASISHTYTRAAGLVRLQVNDGTNWDCNSSSLGLSTLGVVPISAPPVSSGGFTNTYPTFGSSNITINPSTSVGIFYVGDTVTISNNLGTTVELYDYHFNPVTNMAPPAVLSSLTVGYYFVQVDGINGGFGDRSQFVVLPAGYTNSVRPDIGQLPTGTLTESNRFIRVHPSWTRVQVGWGQQVNQNTGTNQWQYIDQFVHKFTSNHSLGDEISAWPDPPVTKVLNLPPEHRNCLSCLPSAPGTIGNGMQDSYQNGAPIVDETNSLASFINDVSLLFSNVAMRYTNSLIYEPVNEPDGHGGGMTFDVTDDPDQTGVLPASMVMSAATHVITYVCTNCEVWGPASAGLLGWPARCFTNSYVPPYYDHVNVLSYHAPTYFGPIDNYVSYTNRLDQSPALPLDVALGQQLGALYPGKPTVIDEFYDDAPDSLGQFNAFYVWTDGSYAAGGGQDQPGTGIPQFDWDWRRMTGRFLKHIIIGHAFGAIGIQPWLGLSSADMRGVADAQRTINGNGASDYLGWSDANAISDDNDPLGSGPKPSIAGQCMLSWWLTGSTRIRNWLSGTPLTRVTPSGDISNGCVPGLHFWSFQFADHSTNTFIWADEGYSFTTNFGVGLTDIWSNQWTGPIGIEPVIAWGWPSSNLDSIGDGVPDWWRAEYFGGDGTTTNSQSCASCDPDDDGFSNLQEYQAGTDPTNPTSHPPNNLPEMPSQFTWFGNGYTSILDTQCYGWVHLDALAYYPLWGYGSMRSSFDAYNACNVTGTNTLAFSWAKIQYLGSNDWEWGNADMQMAWLTNFNMQIGIAWSSGHPYSTNDCPNGPGCSQWNDPPWTSTLTNVQQYAIAKGAFITAFVNRYSSNQWRHANSRGVTNGLQWVEPENEPYAGSVTDILILAACQGARTNGVELTGWVSWSEDRPSWSNTLATATSLGYNYTSMVDAIAFHHYSFSYWDPSISDGNCLGGNLAQAAQLGSPTNNVYYGNSSNTYYNGEDIYTNYFDARADEFMNWLRPQLPTNTPIYVDEFGLDYGDREIVTNGSVVSTNWVPVDPTRVAKEMTMLRAGGATTVNFNPTSSLWAPIYIGGDPNSTNSMLMLVSPQGRAAMWTIYWIQNLPFTCLLSNGNALAYSFGSGTNKVTLAWTYEGTTQPVTAAGYSGIADLYSNVLESVSVLNSNITVLIGDGTLTVP
ncbi:MAG TPA: LamG-like jellyroll fold domain-containing protein [Verrucomicrobiae bacterium]|nr:LamG-like jellyroll fold domain-containing protein [Verrucomicrobiae bacterium]